MNYDKESNKKDFFTDNLFLAATLFASGFEIKQIAGELPHRATFVFRPQKNIDSIAEAYWNDSIKIPPRHLLQSLKSLKDRLYEEARSRGL